MKKAVTAKMPQPADILKTFMVLPAGFEPAAPGLGILCSILLSYGSMEWETDIFRPVIIPEIRRKANHF